SVRVCSARAQVMEISRAAMTQRTREGTMGTPGKTDHNSTALFCPASGRCHTACRGASLHNSDSPQRFVEHDAGGGGEIETALVGRLGNANAPARVAVMDGLWQAGGFVAEDEPVAVVKIGSPEGCFGFARQQPDTIGADGVGKGVDVVVES